jgi:hypothetical protein
VLDYDHLGQLKRAALDHVAGWGMPPGSTTVNVVQIHPGAGSVFVAARVGEGGMATTFAVPLDDPDGYAGRIAWALRDMPGRG